MTNIRPVGEIAYRNFDDDEQEPIPPVGPVFELGGEEFHCVGVPAGGVLPRMISAARVDERGRQVWNNPDIVRFIEDVLCDELPVEHKQAVPDDAAEGTEPVVVMVMEPCDDVDRWRALMEDKKRPIRVARLGDVFSWLVAEYGDRPTKPSGR